MSDIVEYVSPYRILLVLDNVGYLRHFRTLLSEVSQRDDATLDLLFLSRAQANSSQALTKQILKNQKIRFHYFIKNTFKTNRNEAQAADFYFAINKIFWSDPDKANLQALSNRILRKLRVNNQNFNEELTNSLLRQIKSLDPVVKSQTMNLLSKDMVKVIAPARKLEKLLDRVNPDVIVISPFVSGTTRGLPVYVWAKKHKTPVHMAMASWDNLENKNIVLPQPDKVFVWSKYHREKLHVSHGIPLSKIEITGSESLQSWLEMRDLDSSSTNESLRILYLCSSPFISSSKEILVIEKFLAKVECEILSGTYVEVRIRVHPQAPLQPIEDLSKEYLQAKYSWVRFIDTGRVTADTNDEALYFKENVDWATFCVGINTSALLEAACIGRPFVLLAPEVAPHLIPVTSHIKFLQRFASSTINDLDKWTIGDTRKDLINPLRNIEDELPGSFNSSSLLLRHLLVERKTMERKIPLNNSLRQRLRISRKGLENRVYGKIASKISNKKFFKVCQFIFKYGILAFLNRLRLYLEERRYRSLKPVESNETLKVSKVGKEIKVISKKVNGSAFQTVYLVPSKKPLVEEIRYTSRLKRAHEEIISQIAHADKVVIGPWFSELGHEILYWIPFANQLLFNAGKSKNAVGTISRSGADILYRSFSNTNVNALEYYSRNDWHEMINGLWLELGGQKQSSFSFEDHDVMSRVQNKNPFFCNLEGEKIFWLHPSTMFSMFRPFWRNDFSIGTISWLLSWPDYRFSKSHEGPTEVGMKFYGRPSFPCNASNQDFVSKVLQDYSGRNVRIIGDSSYEDDHPMFDLSSARPESLVQIGDYRTNLVPQIEVCGKSATFLSTYGGLNYVPLLFGNKSIGVFSNVEKLLPSHQIVADHLAELKNTSMILKNTMDFSSLQI